MQDLPLAAIDKLHAFLAYFNIFSGVSRFMVIVD